MSLRARIHDLRTAAAVANDEHQVRLRTGELAELSERLKAPTEALPALGIALAEVRLLDIEVPEAIDEESAQVATSLRQLAAELPAMTIDANLDFAKARVRDADKFATQTRGFVAQSWRQYVDTPLPPINEDLVEALAQGGVDVEAIRGTLEGARGQLLALTNRTIPLEGDVEKFGAAIDAIRACGDQIGDVVDPDIAEGIVGVQEVDGMPLNWFTPGRLQKLTDMGIIDRFWVRLK